MIRFQFVHELRDIAYAGIKIDDDILFLLNPSRMAEHPLWLREMVWNEMGDLITAPGPDGGEESNVFDFVAFQQRQLAHLERRVQQA